VVEPHLIWFLLGNRNRGKRADPCHLRGARLRDFPRIFRMIYCDRGLGLGFGFGLGVRQIDADG
jgi:hypothetical protein